MEARPSAFAFSRVAKATSRATGHPVAFVLALGVLAVWGVTGPLFNYSDTWQLVTHTPPRSSPSSCSS